MSSQNFKADTGEGKPLREQCYDYLRSYHRDDLARIVQRGGSSLAISHRDLRRANPSLAEKLRHHPEHVLSAMEKALYDVDLPTPTNLSGIDFQVTDLPSEYIYSPGELRHQHGGQYVGIEGTLERVTSTKDLVNTAAFECMRCGTLTRIPQTISNDDIQEPHECQGCERQGPFDVEDNQSEWSDYAKLRIQSHPDAGSESEGKLVGYALDDVIEKGGPDGLLGRAGEPVTVYGIVERSQRTGRNENGLLHDHILDVRDIQFERDEETVEVEEHREEFERLAERGDAVDLFAESIAPQLHQTEAWDAAMEFAVAYLFGAPRINIDEGPTYRGDIHFLIVSDYAMGKSTFKEDVEAFAPKCISKSTTALSSDVGLTAAAVKDDFGEGAWTVKPGLLVRANGGHLILDEIDKGPDELENMNDALEGEQTVDIEKAGQSATYESRTALMALGNPDEGRFDPHSPIAEQLDIPESLLSRFDGIVTMTDDADVEQDEAIAGTWGRSFTEAAEYQYGDREELEHLNRPVPIDVGRAWVQHAHENVNPILRYEQFESLKEWYSDEVRQLNQDFAGDGEGSKMPVPATVRELAAATKMSIAFARVHLRDEVAAADVERAKKLAKRLVKQNWDGEKFDATMNVSQNDRIGQMWSAIRSLEERSDDSLASKEEIISQVNAPDRDVRNDINKAIKEGDLTEPEYGYVRTT